MSEQLKPCPFCGGPAEIWPRQILQESYHSECEDCGATGHSHVGCTVEEAIAAWNQRYLPMTYSVDNATVTINDLRTATLFHKQQAELVALRALREACEKYGQAMADDRANDGYCNGGLDIQDAEDALWQALAECEKAAKEREQC